jgi:hypothetical protein
VLEEHERTGVLIVRAWMARGSRTLLARITGRPNVDVEEETTATVAGPDAAAEYVRDWLREFEAGEERPDGDVTVT